MNYFIHMITGKKVDTKSNKNMLSGEGQWLW